MQAGKETIQSENHDRSLPEAVISEWKQVVDEEPDAQTRTKLTEKP